MKQKEAAEAEVEILLSEKVEIESTLASIDEQIEAGKDEIEEHKATLEEINSQLAEAEKKVQSKTADIVWLVHLKILVKNMIEICLLSKVLLIRLWNKSKL